MATSQNIESMKLPELKELAKQMGLRGTSTMRKPDLIATLQAARTGGKAPDGVSVRAPKKTAATKAVTTAPASASVPVPASAAPASAPSASATPFTQPAESAEPAATSEAVTSERDNSEPAGRTRTARSGRKQAEQSTEHDQRSRSAERRGSRRLHASDDDNANLFDELHIDIPTAKNSESAHAQRREAGQQSGGETRRRRRTDSPRTNHEPAVRDLDDILATLPTQTEEESPSEPETHEREFTRRTRNRDRSERNGDDRRQRRTRNRDRDYDNRDNHDNRDEREEHDERRDSRRGDNANVEDFVPVAGIVDVLESYAFVRTSGYLPGPNDVYVSMGQVKKYGLRKGDAVHGSIRTPREGERRNQRQKFVPLQSIDAINGMSVEDSANRPHFSKLTPLYPQERLKQETTPNKIIGRMIDIISPIGKGQRGLIVSPPKAGKTITLQNIANSIATNNPEVHLMVVLVDERPEEVTDMERTVQGEVISSTFDRPASDHTTVAELAIERAKRLVELGQDVVVLLDSMTRLARAYNISAPASGRILSGGVDAQALYPPKKFFGAARNIENGGSLTIISSALVETGSKMDEVIFEEFKGTGNMELRLSRELADKRLFPAIDINASGTRREELITPNDELAIIYRLRRLFGGLEPEQAYQTLVTRLKKTPTNRDFLSTIVQPSNRS